MKFDIYMKFRIIYQIGLVLLFVSLFLEWYIFQVYDSSGRLIAYWAYNPIIGWSTIFSEDSTTNYLFKPNTIQIPIIIIIIYILILILSTYSLLFKNVERITDIEKLYPYAYIHIFLLALVSFFLFIFPILYLIPNNLYFPFLQVKDNDIDVRYFYRIGSGYCLQIIGFIMIFPYSIFYYQTITKFKTQQDSSKKIVDNYIQQVKEIINFDQLIANEKIKLEFEGNDFIELESSKLYQKKGEKKKVFPQCMKQKIPN